LAYTADFSAFRASAADKIEQVKARPRLSEEDQDRDDLIFMTSIPWISFTSLSHPIHMNPVDSVPRIAWGKFNTEGDGLKMPISVQGHHGLMDGLHVAKFLDVVQSLLNTPDKALGGEARILN
jgi:chloramphenicol O-acetyltransferase type A